MDNLEQDKIGSGKHFILFFLLAAVMFFNLLFFLKFHGHILYMLPAVLDLAVLTALVLLLHKWVILPYSDIVLYLREYSSSVNASIPLEDTDSKLFPHIVLKKIIETYKEHERQQDELMLQLKQNNELLQRNNKIMDSFIQVTNEILSSGDIETVLQSILDRAIEIIPRAQKGSILIYNGEEFVFKAVKGYDFNVLKNFSFRLEEAYQYGAEDFFEPVIINDVEAYNSKKLSSNKFKILKKGRGFELQSSLSCAISVDNELYGLINLDNAGTRDAFGEEDKPLIKHLAVQIGMAFKNAALLEKIIYLSRHDSLTGLYNRNCFDELLTRVFEQALEEEGIFSLAMLDINDLKMVNDTYGHEAGDLLIKNFVETVSGRLDSCDIFARTGGDEFTIIFPCKDKQQVEKVMAEIDGDFAASPFTYCGRKIFSISYGCGITSYPEDSESIDVLLRMADSCMYAFKKKYKEGLCTTQEILQ